MTPPKPIADVHTCHATCPCQTSKLGPLEFTAEDFESEFLQLPPSYLPVVAEIANRLLAERLGKAPEISIKKMDTWRAPGDPCLYEGAGAGVSTKNYRYTHRARLVCIEKLEGK